VDGAQGSVAGAREKVEGGEVWYLLKLYFVAAGLKGVK